MNDEFIEYINKEKNYWCDPNRTKDSIRKGVNSGDLLQPALKMWNHQKEIIDNHRKMIASLWTIYDKAGYLLNETIGCDDRDENRVNNAIVELYKMYSAHSARVAVEEIFYQDIPEIYRD